MPRGQTSEVGERRKQQNGYWTIRTEEGWRFEHHVVAERIILGRELKPNEMVKFRDNDKDNLHPDNLLIVKKGRNKERARLAVVLRTIKELEAERDELMKVLESS